MFFLSSFGVFWYLSIDLVDVILYHLFVLGIFIGILLEIDFVATLSNSFLLTHGLTTLIYCNISSALLISHYMNYLNFIMLQTNCWHNWRSVIILQNVSILSFNEWKNCIPDLQRELFLILHFKVSFLLVIREKNWRRIYNLLNCMVNSFISCDSVPSGRAR